MSQELKIVLREVTPATVGEVEAHFADLGKQGWVVQDSHILGETYSDASRTTTVGFRIAIVLVRNVGEPSYVASGSDEVKRGRGRPPKAVEPSFPCLQNLITLCKCLI